MSLNESIAEDAAFEWFAEQSRYAQSLTPTLSHRERELYGEVVLVGCLREAIRRFNPAIPKGARATHKESLSVHIERRLNP